MPKFIKIKVGALPNSKDDHLREGSCGWKMLIDNAEDLIRYIEHDQYASANAFLSLSEKNTRGDFSHMGGLSGREEGLARWLSIVTHTKEGKIYPIIEAANITDQKHRGMMKCVLRGDAIGINSNSTYCVLKSYMATWSKLSTCEIVEELEKDGFSFPTDEEVTPSDTLILENSYYEGYKKYDIGRIKEALDVLGEEMGEVKGIYSLEERDERYVYKSIAAAKNIYIKSEFLNQQQVEKFMKIFMSLDKKNIILYSDKNGYERLESIPMFQELSKKHIIIKLTW